MICKCCNQDFIPGKYKKIQKYCSKKCKERARTQRRSESGEFIEKSQKYRQKNLEAIRQYDRNRVKIRQKSGENAWYKINFRCNNPRSKGYKYYGGKGVRNLLSKEQFLKIYFSTAICCLCSCVLEDQSSTITKNRRTIDRIDASGHYEESNVRIVCLSCNSKYSNTTRKNITGLCEICRQQYETTSHQRKYCSSFCREKAYYARHHL